LGNSYKNHGLSRRRPAFNLVFDNRYPPLRFGILSASRPRRIRVRIASDSVLMRLANLKSSTSRTRSRGRDTSFRTVVSGFTAMSVISSKRCQCYHHCMSAPETGSLWAKLKRDASRQVIGWHSLVNHSADVSAVIEALLDQPTLNQRLARSAGRDRLDHQTCTRAGTHETPGFER
jgi:hypothetical protein